VIGGPEHQEGGGLKWSCRSRTTRRYVWYRSPSDAPVCVEGTVVMVQRFWYSFASLNACQECWDNCGESWFNIVCRWRWTKSSSLYGRSTRDNVTDVGWRTTVWVKKNPPPQFFLTFFPKRLGIFVQILHTYCKFQFTLDYKFLSNYL